MLRLHELVQRYSRLRPAPDEWLAAHQAHQEQARLEFLANRRTGLPVDDEPDIEWVIDARRRARTAINVTTGPTDKVGRQPRLSQQLGVRYWQEPVIK